MCRRFDSLVYAFEKGDWLTPTVCAFGKVWWWWCGSSGVIVDAAWRETFLWSIFWYTYLSVYYFYVPTTYIKLRNMYLLYANPLSIRRFVHVCIITLQIFFLSEWRNEWKGITSFDIAAKLEWVLFWHFCLTTNIRFDMNSLV